MEKAHPAFDKPVVGQPDETVLNELMVSYGNELTNLAYSYVHDWGQAEDIVQEVFVKCFQKMSSFRGDSSYRTWLYRITINKCKDVKKSWAYRHIQTSSLESMFSLSSNESTPEEEASRRSGQEELAKVVLTLPIKYREVIMLHYYSDLKVDEISQLLKKNAKTVRTRLFRAKKLLKQKLEEVPSNG